MLLSKIARLVNKALAGELLMYEDMTYYLDKAIDGINNELNTTFPVFSELDDFATEYNFFPDTYIRQVVIPGAAWRYFNADEEGNNGSPQYETDMREGLFYMKRDYSDKIPEEYQSDNTGGILFEVESVTGDRGLEIDGINWQL
jgi:hypothetical protein